MAELNLPIDGSTAKALSGREYVFTLNEMFQRQRLDFTDETYFSKRGHGAKYADLPTFSNPYMENEMRGFLQHMAIDNHNTASYVSDYIREFFSVWARFCNEKHPDMCSVADNDYETLYREYFQWLEDNGFQTIVNRQLPQVTKDMEWLRFDWKLLSLLGVGAFYRYVDSVRFPDTGDEREKDIWDVRNLGVPYSTLPSRPRYTVNYTKITQGWLKQQVKDYNYYRIQHREIATVEDDMKAFNLFSSFLEKQHPEITSLTQLDRTIAEEYIAFVRAKGYVASTFNRRISAIKTLLTLGNMMDMGGYPTKPLFSNSDYSKVKHKLPVPFSDRELRQMNDNIDKLPVQYGRIFFVLENCGMRMSDLCSTRINIDGQYCLQQHGEDHYIFTYEMHKVHRTNTVPVSELVAEVIKSAIDDSRSTYGDDCLYIFAKSKDEPIGQEDFVMSMNKLSLRNGFTTDTGKPLRIKGHTFRRTKATEYANMGVSLDVIRIMLGQKKIGVLKHYITIHSTTMIDALQNITAEDEALIRNIGNEPDLVLKENAEAGLLPLSNGFCAKGIASGLCDHAYACYSCRMYRPGKQFLPLYERQLREVCNNISVAELNGYERLLQVNTELKEQLEKIIRAVRGGE